MRFIQQFTVIVAAMVGLGLSQVHAQTLLLHSTMDDADIVGSTVLDTALPAQNGVLDAGASSGAVGLFAQAINSAGTVGTTAVDYGDVLDPGAGIQTASVWFNADTIKTQYVFNKGNTASTTIGWSIFTESRNSGAFLRVAVRATATGVGDNPNRAIAWTDLAADGSDSTNTWHHVAYVMDATAGTVAGYLDGILMTATNSWGMTFTTDGDGVATSAPLSIGNIFDGRIDDAGQWDGAVAAEKIALIHGLGRFGGVTLNSSSIDDVLNVFNTAGGSANAGGYTWSYATGLASSTVGAVGGDTATLDAFIVLDSSGNGVQITASALHPGDANGDGMVNLSDLQILGDNWQSNTATWAEADFTGDNTVNLADLQILGDNWGFGTGPDVSFDEALAQVAIPEPGACSLLAAGGLLVMLRRRG
ncbi:MAG: hypothetical protein IT445_03655 [Phycisphaeraceae bacterium]|nr:hypothetical protein [Phycisphaeraceae bacterium]